MHLDTIHTSMLSDLHSVGSESPKEEGIRQLRYPAHYSAIYPERRAPLLPWINPVPVLVEALKVVTELLGNEQMKDLRDTLETAAGGAFATMRHPHGGLHNWCWTVEDDALRCTMFCTHFDPLQHWSWVVACSMAQELVANVAGINTVGVLDLVVHEMYTHKGHLGDVIARMDDELDPFDYPDSEPLGKDTDIWVEETRHLLDKGPVIGFKSKWHRTTAAPLFHAFANNDSSIEDRIGVLAGCRSTDWRLACQLYLESTES